MALDVSIPPLRRSREWLTGMRPVAGAVGACSLMLLACSWFAFRPGSVDAGSDVRSPAPVRIDNAGRGAARGTQPRAVPASTRQRTPVVRRAITPRRSSPGAATRDIRASTGRPQRSPLPAAPAKAAPPSPAPGSPSAPASATPPATPALPSLPDDLPSVPLPPVSLPPVSLPQAPPLPSVQVPDLPTTTTPLGLP
jgi:hypothetical protein